MVQIKLSDLTPNKYNPREIFRGAAMEELKDSMADVGLIHPILVRPLKNNKSEVVAGMRRYYAANDLKWESIECHSRELNDLDSVKIAFSENIKRENLNPIELGKMYQTYMEYLPQTETKNKKAFKKSESMLLEEVAHEFNISNITVRNYISLLILPEELRSLIVLNHGDMKKGFSVTYGFELARIPSEQILDFYKIYNPKDYTTEQYQKKVSEKIAENKLEGEKKIKKLEGNLNKAQLEIEKLIQRQEAFEERINKNIEKVDYGEVEKAIEENNEVEEEIEESNYDNVEKAIEFLTKQLEEFQSEEKLDKLAKDIKHNEHQVDDLDILLDRTDKEAISICPYCLAKIDINIINKRKELFEAEVKNFRDELKEINSTMDFNQDLKRDLESDYEFLVEILTKIEQKEKEVGDITDAISGL
ncbi:hypothetical protein LCGC14_2392230 [marine sediment metagenome]|uniref:ParB-like N-terminal domain-containing protein n=1 Tax=marine sediment metagenome TaxID=412755 RepID=A0A0F9BXW6_9ZZZZ